MRETNRTCAVARVSDDNEYDMRDAGCTMDHHGSLVDLISRPSQELREDRHPSAAIFVERSYTSSSNGHSDMRSDNVEGAQNIIFISSKIFLLINPRGRSK
jgi:hypothetical protein